MSVSKYLMTAALVGVVFAGPACSDRAVDETKRDTGTALDATKAGADKAIDVTKTGVDKAIDATKRAGDETADVTKDVAQKTADNTKEIAGEVAEKSREVASATGAAVSDGWITTKVKAKLADETVLEGSDITVDTNDHVVTLRGTVLSGAAKVQAEVIARGTEGVTRVVSQLVVKSR
jgi:hyperosmotically inducible periplasmic protein